MKDVMGKNVIITGAAKGLGRLFAEKFAADGARLVLVDLDEAELSRTAEEIRQIGTQVDTYAVDLSERENIEALADDVHADVGKMDVVVNNAGVVFGGPFLDVDIEKHELTYRVNIQAVVWMTRAFLPDLIDKRAGHFLNIASASGLVGVPGAATYASSKWACIGFSESIRGELSQMGYSDIKVTIVCPSFIDTGMFEGVKAPLLTPILEPQAIVDKAYEAFKKDDVYVLEPFMVKLTPALKALLPLPVFDLLGKIFRVNRSMDTWKGH